MTKLFVCLMATVFAASAFAANKNTAPTTAVTPNASTAFVAPKAATTTLSVPAEQVKPVERKWLASWTAESTVNAANANSGDTKSTEESYQHVNLGYKLSPTQTIEYRQHYYYNYSEASRNNEWSIGEPVIRLASAKVIDNGNITASNDARLYLPGSKYVREVGQVYWRNIFD